MTKIIHDKYISISDNPKIHFHRFHFVSNQNSIRYNGPIHIFPKYSNKQDDDDSGDIQDLSKSRV